MGLRGPLPQTTVYQAPPLEDLSPPSWLCEVGKQHWQQHCEHAARNGLLTSATAQHFGLMCDSWARLFAFNGKPNDRLYDNAVKTYDRHAKLWRLLPCDKPGTAVDHRHQDKAGFTF